MRNNLKEILKEKGVSVLELGRNAKIAPQVLYNISNEKIVAYEGWKKRIAEALEVPIGEIFPEGVEEND